MALGFRSERDCPLQGHDCENSGVASRTAAWLEITAADTHAHPQRQLPWSSPTGGGERGDEPLDGKSPRIADRRKVNNRYGLVSLGVTRGYLEETLRQEAGRLNFPMARLLHPSPGRLL